MKLRIDRETLIKWAGILLLIAVLPFAAELILVIDVFGLEFAVSFMFLYLGMIRDRLILRWLALRQAVTDFIWFISRLYLFRPTVFISHSLASGIIVGLTCSMLLAAAFWIPALYLSSGFF